MRLVKASGGEAGFGYDHEIRKAKGWRQFETDDVAARLDLIRDRVASLGVRILHMDAVAFTEAWASELAPTAVDLDPPYQDKTGYPCVCLRPDVLRIAETWARHGHRTVLHEAVSLRADLGAGWTDARLSRPGAAKEEWVTCYGVDVRALLPGLLRGAA